MFLCNWNQRLQASWQEMRSVRKLIWISKKWLRNLISNLFLSKWAFSFSTSQRLNYKNVWYVWKTGGDIHARSVKCTIGWFQNFVWFSCLISNEYHNLANKIFKPTSKFRRMLQIWSTSRLFGRFFQKACWRSTSIWSRDNEGKRKNDSNIEETERRNWKWNSDRRFFEK